VSIVDDAEKVMEVIVEDKQLSLAIGKKGQNVRLAAKLTGWKIDIKSEEEKRREVEAQLGALEIGEPQETSADEPAEAAGADVSAEDAAVEASADESAEQGEAAAAEEPAKAESNQD
jgi:N utilization substance protein A